MSGVLLSVAKLTRITAALKWLEVPGTVSIEVKPHQFSSLWKKKKRKKGDHLCTSTACTNNTFHVYTENK